MLGVRMYRVIPVQVPWPLSCECRETILLCLGLLRSCVFSFLVKRSTCVSFLCSLTGHTGPVCESGAVGDAGGPGAAGCYAAARAGLHSWG